MEVNVGVRSWVAWVFLPCECNVDQLGNEVAVSLLNDALLIVEVEREVYVVFEGECVGYYGLNLMNRLKRVVRTIVLLTDPALSYLFKEAFVIDLEIVTQICLCVDQCAAQSEFPEIAHRELLVFQEDLDR